MNLNLWTAGYPSSQYRYAYPFDGSILLRFFVYCSLLEPAVKTLTPWALQVVQP